jgi:hypothetical protein
VWCGGVVGVVVVVFFTDYNTTPTKLFCFVLCCWSGFGNKSAVKNIAVASLYYTEATRSKALLDYISETVNFLGAKFGPNLHDILAGDFNKLRIGPILNSNPQFCQVVTVPTRCNPDAILDKIVTTLWMYYQDPFTISPLDNDENKKVEPSDHKIVVFEPLFNPHFSNQNYRTRGVVWWSGGVVYQMTKER